ncbi:MAG: hypothetical protein ACFFDN_48040 [Candidatus Hodarchaeota archaeon]
MGQIRRIPCSSYHTVWILTLASTKGTFNLPVVIGFYQEVFKLIQNVVRFLFHLSNDK